MRPDQCTKMGQGCKKCFIEGRKNSWNKVLARFKRDNEGFFKNDYSKAVYINADTPIEIRCTIHNHIFWMTPTNHYNNQDCVMCSKRKTFSTKEELIKLCQEAHNRLF